MFDALPSGNGRLSGKDYWLPHGGAFVPRRGPVDSFCAGQRVAFQVVAVARLSSTLARCLCSRPVFVPRDEHILRCVKYTIASGGCQAIYGLGSLPGKITLPCTMAYPGRPKANVQCTSLPGQPGSPTTFFVRACHPKLPLPVPPPSLL
jgi:hypothetical protein